MWEKTRKPGGNPHRHRQTMHRDSTQTVTWVEDQLSNELAMIPLVPPCRPQIKTHSIKATRLVCKLPKIQQVTVDNVSINIIYFLYWEKALNTNRWHIQYVTIWNEAVQYGTKTNNSKWNGSGNGSLLGLLHMTTCYNQCHASIAIHMKKFQRYVRHLIMWLNCLSVL